MNSNVCDKLDQIHLIKNQLLFLRLFKDEVYPGYQLSAHDVEKLREAISAVDQFCKESLKGFQAKSILGFSLRKKPRQ